MKKPKEEILEHMSKPMTRMEAVQLMNPIRAMLGDLIGSMVVLSAGVALEGHDAGIREKGTKAFDRLEEIFKHMDAFDARLTQVLGGLPIEDSSTDEQPFDER